MKLSKMKNGLLQLRHFFSHFNVNNCLNLEYFGQKFTLKNFLKIFYFSKIVSLKLIKTLKNCLSQMILLHYYNTKNIFVKIARVRQALKMFNLKNKISPKSEKLKIHLTCVKFLHSFIKLINKIVYKNLDKNYKNCLM